MPEESATPSAAAEPRSGPPSRSGRRRWPLRAAVLLAALAWVGTAAYYATLPLPPGIRTSAPWVSVPATDVRFLRDLTAADAYGRPVVDQQIFDQAFAIIGHARRFILLDYFLFTDPPAAADAGDPAAPLPTRALSQELESALLRRKTEVPGLRVVFITDPINDFYAGGNSPLLQHLRAAGITVVTTDLDRLPDSDPIYSGLWRLLVRWWTPTPARGVDAPAGRPHSHPAHGGDPGFGAWARRLNFKSNQRKVLIADDGDAQLVGLISSANPQNSSSAQSNVALRIVGPALLPLLGSELAIARACGWRGELATGTAANATAPPSERDFLAGRTVRVRILTEGAIRGALVERIDEAVRGDSIDVAMFYVSDRDVIEALLAAAARGVIVRALLDPNRDAFGDEKSALPNRQVASELIATSDGAIKVRWFRTHGEQFHSKLIAIYGPDRFWFMLGSANLTRRNLGDYNLEADLAVEASRAAAIGDEVVRYFEGLWSNRAVAGVEYSSPYDVYADPSQGRYWLYRLMEGTGLSAF
jgi:phosphatidylserine/phosphatidylglycerophosphate/cardiolipin synthase-like enzyme